MAPLADLENHRIEGFVKTGEPLSVPLYSEIEPGLFQGGSPAYALGVLPDGVDAVLNLYGDSYPRQRGVEYREQALLDVAYDPDGLDELAAWVDERRRAGKGVLVHCQAGLNRSGLITSLYLTRHRGLSPDEAISLQRRQRCELVLCNGHFEAIVRGE